MKIIAIKVHLIKQMLMKRQILNIKGKQSSILMRGLLIFSIHMRPMILYSSLCNKLPLKLKKKDLTNRKFNNSLIQIDNYFFFHTNKILSAVFNEHSKPGLALKKARTIGSLLVSDEIITDAYSGDTNPPIR